MLYGKDFACVNDDVNSGEIPSPGHPETPISLNQGIYLKL